MAELYYEKESVKARIAAEKFAAALPDYAKEFILSKTINKAPKTAKGYASDIRVFFEWVCLAYPEYSSDCSAIPVSFITALKPKDLNLYECYLKDGDRANRSAAIQRKKVALRQFYKFLLTNDYYDGKNPVDGMENSSFKSTVNYEHLEPEEIDALLQTVLNHHQKSPNLEAVANKTRLRDYTLIVTMLGTGLRISELVGIDLQDFNFEKGTVRVVRKGFETAQELPIGDDVKKTVRQYLGRVRLKIKGIKSGDENAMFLSVQKRRISVSAVERMLAKYVDETGIYRKISPHKLRKTFGMSIYKNSGDIYTTAAALGHTDVKVTTRHYVEADRKKIADAVSQLEIIKKQGDR